MDVISRNLQLKCVGNGKRNEHDGYKENAAK